MAIDFPASPTLNQTFSSGNVNYVWDGTKWTASVTGGISLDKIQEGNTSAEVVDTGSDGRFVVTTDGVEALRVDASQRVGIGTSTPSVLLHTQDNSLSSTTPGANIVARFQTNGTGRDASILLGDTTDSSSRIGQKSGNITFHPGSATERARIDSSGRLLVGTSSARSNFRNGSQSAQIQLEGTSADTSRLAIINNSNTDTGFLYFARSKGTTTGSNTVVTSGDYLGSIIFAGNDGSEFVDGATIDAIVDGTPGANDLPTRLVFSTTADGASSSTERMRITNYGALLIGTTDNNVHVVNSGSGFSLQEGTLKTTNNGAAALLNRHTSDGEIIRLQRQAVTVGSISVTTSATAYNTSSDYRLKENVVTVTDGITRLQQLKPSRFNFIADPAKTVDGFIAHEVQDVVPEAITGAKDAVDDDGNPIYQGIDQSKLVPLLTAALQEAISEIESLKARVAALESA